MNMTEGLKIALKEICDNEFRQNALSNRIYELTEGRYSKESITGNVFRNVKNYPSFFKSYIKRKVGTASYWRKQITEYKQAFDKPTEYFQALQSLNASNTIYTLCGTESNCLSVLDRSKTVTVDFCRLTKPDVSGNIGDMKRGASASFNLYFEGIFSEKKANDINALSADKIVLTFKSSKNDKYLDLLNFKVTHVNTYKSGKWYMKIYLLEKII